MNALDAEMFEALVAATDRLSREKGVRAVVLSGEGRPSAPARHGRFAAMNENGGNGIPGGGNRDLTARTHGRPISRSRRVGWRQLPVPVIAAFTASRLAADSSSRSAPTCAFSALMRGCRSWKSNGAWCLTWPDTRSREPRA